MQKKWQISDSGWKCFGTYFVFSFNIFGKNCLSKQRRVILLLTARSMEALAEGQETTKTVDRKSIFEM